MKNVNHLSWGLFNLRGVRSWRNIKDISIFINRIFFLLKHGYPEQARWETFPWFMDTMREVLTWHRHHRVGTGYILDEVYKWDEEQDERNEEAYNDGLDRMIKLLDKMDEDNDIYAKYRKDGSYQQIELEMEAAKDEFFKLFSKYFYQLWD